MSEFVPFCRCLQVVSIDNFTLTFYVLTVYVTTLSDHAVAQADILGSEAMFKFQESLCKICGGQRGDGTGCFSPSIRLSSVSIIPSVFHTHIHLRKR
jgi:hypothetical protein